VFFCHWGSPPFLHAGDYGHLIPLSRAGRLEFRCGV